MDVWTTIGGLALIVGIIAGVVQVLDYLQKRREKPDEPGEEFQPPLPPPAPPIPHNLPPRSEFIGQVAEKARVHEALRSRSYLVGIDGIGGIGKTVLALEVAHECLRASRSESPMDGIATFDGFIWTTAKDRDLTLNALLDAIARTLDYPGIAQQPVEEKQTAVRKLLQEKPYLVIVDNFETVTDEGVRGFLLNLPEPSKALITTREQKLRQAWAISLKGLTKPEAFALIRNEGRRLGLTALEHAEDQVPLHLYQATGGAPLAIKWSVGQIKQKGQSLDTALAALRQARGDIFNDIVARSWGLLSTGAQQVLMVMPLFATSASREGIEAASDVHHFALDEALGQLVEMSLVDATDDLDLTLRRYSVHPLTRSFAKARLDEDHELEQDARVRLVAYYVERCQGMGKWAYTAGFPWFEVELPNIFAVIEWANGVEQWSAVTSIFRSLIYFLGTAGYWEERVRYGYVALKAAQRENDRVSEAVCFHALGWILQQRGQYEEAEEHLLSCIELYLDVGQERDAVLAKITLAEAAMGMGNLEGAQEVITEAAEAARHYRPENVPSGLFAVQGEIEMRLGNLQEARRLVLAALESVEERGGSPSTGSRLITLGRIALAQSQLDEAEFRFRSGLESSKKYMRQDNIAKANFGLAMAYDVRGDRQRAEELARRAREQFLRMGMKRELQESDDFLAQLERGEG